jgi:catechol 2,3-dioxygenase-like lactoylglutathione lyase family enzyme
MPREASRPTSDGEAVHQRAVGHVGLTVPDVDAAAAWYLEIFGWRLLMPPVTLSTQDARVADQLRGVFGAEVVAFRQAHLLADNEVAIELFQFEQPRQTPRRADFEYWSPGIFHLCVVDPDIEALAARIAARGGRRRTPVQPIFPDEPYLFCYCEDPYGNIIELASHSHHQSFGGRLAY